MQGQNVWGQYGHDFHGFYGGMHQYIGWTLIWAGAFLTTSQLGNKMVHDNGGLLFQGVVPSQFLLGSQTNHDWRSVPYAFCVIAFHFVIWIWKHMNTV